MIQQFWDVVELFAMHLLFKPSDSCRGGRAWERGYRYGTYNLGLVLLHFCMVTLSCVNRQLFEIWSLILGVGCQ